MSLNKKVINNMIQLFKLSALAKKEVRQVLTRLKRIEAQAYPEYMQMYGDLKSLEDVREYCESDTINVALTETAYMVMTDDELVDLACIGKLTLADVNAMKEVLKATFKQRTIRCDARHTTSWRLLKVFAARGEINLLETSTWSWEDELFHEVEFYFVGDFHEPDLSLNYCSQVISGES